ncbi:ABC transporter permease [uncultured Winogradskyella sp.]|uniref:ABC transporter permease n=1 Tax=uncultured Winogradskyella sp. TaxID=395353 RepID=UPI00351140A4
MKDIILKLAIKSIRNRKASVLLSIISIALSIVLLLGIQRIITSLEESFSSTISGTDLIVGAPNGNLSLLLATVFHKGNVNQSISWEAYENIKSYPEIDWTIPIALGDSHKGYTVIGTTEDLFSHFKYGSNVPLTASQGQFDISEMQCVVGSKVAKDLDYNLNDELVLTHGMGKEDFSTHKENPFKVSAILNPTGTPIDNALIVSLDALERIHEHFYHSSQESYDFLAIEHDHRIEDEHMHPESITGFYLGVKSKPNIPSVQRKINTEDSESLLAIMPAVTLLELWTIIKPIENILMIISVVVLLVSLGSVLTTIITNMSQRRREMAVLRSIGARPNHIFGLILVEAFAIVLVGILSGFFILNLALWIAKPFLAQHFGIILDVLGYNLNDVYIVMVILIAGIIIGILPAIRAYKQTLADGLTIKI